MFLDVYLLVSEEKYVVIILVMVNVILGKKLKTIGVFWFKIMFAFFNKLFIM